MKDEQLLPRYPGLPSIVDGAEAIAHVESRMPPAFEEGGPAGGRVVSTGVLFARDVQEAADLTAIARRVAAVTGTPFVVAQEGLLTTRTIGSVRLPEDELLRMFAGDPVERASDLPGPADAPDIDRIRAALDAAMTEWTALTARPVGAVDAYRCAGASEILVSMGTTADTAIAVVDHLRAQGRPVGSVAVTSFRPFPTTELLAVLRRARSVGVVERVDDPLAAANPLTREVRSALYDAAAEGVMVPRVLSFSAGPGSDDIAAGDLLAVFGRLAVHGELPARHAVLGTKHPLALDRVRLDLRPSGAWSLRGDPVGAYWPATAIRLVATLAGDLFEAVVLAHPRSGPGEDGVATTYDLTIADAPIRLHAGLEQADAVPLRDVSAITLGDPLAGLVDGGTIFIRSTSADPEAIWLSIPASVRAEIVARRIRVTALDTASLAAVPVPMADPPSRTEDVALVGVFLRVSPFAARAGLDRTALMDAVRDHLAGSSARPADAVVDADLAVIGAAYDGLIDVTATLGLLPDAAGGTRGASLETEGAVR
jgi:pyruvate-ferredoxin/flavodoxin oxidoreductase